MPYGKPVRRNGSWDKAPAREVELDKSNDLVSREVQLQLKTWWLAVTGRGKGARTPNWDIASTCAVRDKPGLLLIEAKAHSNELDSDGKSLRSSASPNSIKNHERIGLAITEAAAQFQRATRKTLGHIPRPPLPAIQPVCVVLEAGIARRTCRSSLSRIPERSRHGQRWITVPIPGGVGEYSERSLPWCGR